MAAPAASDMDQQVDLSTIPISPDGGQAGGSSTDADGKVVTVFHDKENFNVKHQLQNKWTLWFTKPPSGKVGLRSATVLAGLTKRNTADII